MLCEISTVGGFVPIWASLTGIGLILTGSVSSLLFYQYYGVPTYARWLLFAFMRRSN